MAKVLLKITVWLFFIAQLSMTTLYAQELPNSHNDLWNKVRQGEAGYTAVPNASPVLIDNSGQNWRQLRNATIATYGAWLFGGILLAFIVLLFTRGQIRLEKPRTGNKIKRWHEAERLLHWYTAFLFIIMSLTGLLLLYGKAIVLPYVDKTLFAFYLKYCMIIHNYAANFFLFGFIIMILVWLVHSFPRTVDKQWFTQLGGLLSHHPIQAGFFNAGQKIWYWLIFWVGFVVIGSGFYINLPIFGQTIAGLQLASILHSGFSVIWIAAALIHIYAHLIGREGSLESMTTGQVDETWAKQHHVVWYQEIQDEK